MPFTFLFDQNDTNETQNAGFQKLDLQCLVYPNRLVK